MKPYYPDLVKEIYESELSGKQGHHKTVFLHRVSTLEVSRYLEYYLWPNFDPDSASFEHVMTAWVCFSDNKDLFKAFLERVLRLKKQARTLSIAENTNYLLFMINLFQSLEDDIVSQTVLKLASLRVWSCLSPGRFQMEMCLNPNLIKKWKKMIKKESKVAEKRGEPFDLLSKLEVKFVKNLIEEFLEILDSQVFSDHEDSQLGGLKQVDNGCVLYCERFMEFLMDLLSQLPTRRFLRPVVADVALYEGFEINDHTGKQLSDDNVLVAHYSRVKTFQLLTFEKVPKLNELALSDVGSMHRRSDLSKELSVLSPEELKDLVCDKLKLVSEKDSWTERVDFLLEVMVSFLEKRQSQKEAINALPLYPNEQIMWDESLVPSVNYSGEGCQALPKLNLQFLTLHDYLLRNFNLFRLESTYEIREDIQEAIPHLLAYINIEGETAFRGWSRMGVPIKEFKIKEVKQPNIGEVKPAAVTADVTFSISIHNAQVRSEWNSLKEHDVLFLLSIRPSFEPLSSEEAAKLTVPERLGLQFVRGCEVIEIRDEEGGLMNDFTGRIKRDEWKPPKGELRTVTVALDTAQYFMDVNDIAEKGADDVYGKFNILLRRKPKENNFKAILESIRDLMNESLLDFKDTFVDADHLTRSFPDYQVCFTGPDGTGISNPEPPFRLKFPMAMKSSSLVLPGTAK
ncbi:hypothetical protein C5167_008270 [Papaver somniferum]|uniref:Intron-binding protein aquarius N-terminal domain-containing protein n=1 Tax=Papaver somniferum TaxID=3469 RepID=A0A4Y7JX05_PAPSO|nr:hypothetical protein C5167_008270 [Papaver somniferum]